MQRRLILLLALAAAPLGGSAHAAALTIDDILAAGAAAAEPTVQLAQAAHTPAPTPPPPPEPAPVDDRRRPGREQTFPAPIQQTNPGAVAPYLEAAVGLHLLSHTSVSLERRFSTAFQFGNHLGLGLRFGSQRAFDLGYRFQHLSNAGIKRPNQGINFHQVRFQYHF